MDDRRGHGWKLIEMIDLRHEHRHQLLKPIFCWFWTGVPGGQDIREIRPRQVCDPPGISLLEIVAIEPVQLVEIEDGRRGRNALERKSARQLIERERLGLAVFGSP